MVERLRNGSRVFRASWHSGQVWAAVGGALFAVAMTWKAFGVAGKGWQGLMAVFFGGATWLIVRLQLSDTPVLIVGPLGVGSYWFKGHTIPWSEIAEVEHQSVQGQDVIHFVLRPDSPSLALTKSLIGGGLRRVVSLSPLSPVERQAAKDAVEHGFQRYAVEQSRAAALAATDAAVAEQEFQERLVARTPLTWALYVVIAVNVAVLLMNLLGGVNIMRPTSADLFAWGANSTTAVVRDGEYWRLLTATVLHAGVMHLALNMLALWDAGRQVCRWFGNGQFLLIYLGSALAGSALSLHFSAQQAVSVGASGAVFGVLGALLTGVYQHRERVPKRMAMRLLASQGVFVTFILVQGFIRPGIDNAAHLGGLVTGSVMAWLLIELVDEQAGEVKRMFRRVLSTAMVALIVAALSVTAKPGIDHRQLIALDGLMQRVLPSLLAAQTALNRDRRAVEDGRMGRIQLIEAMERKHMPAYRKVGEALMSTGSSLSAPLRKDLWELQGTTLELMALQVGEVRGAVRQEQATWRHDDLNRRLSAVNRRMLDHATEALHAARR